MAVDRVLSTITITITGMEAEIIEMVKGGQRNGDLMGYTVYCCTSKITSLSGAQRVRPRPASETMSQKQVRADDSSAQ